MNLLIFIPIVIAVVVLILVFGRRGGSQTRPGTGDRRDSTERPELTGPEQHKHRE